MSISNLTTLLRDQLVQWHTAANSLSLRDSCIDPDTGLLVPYSAEASAREELLAILRPGPSEAKRNELTSPLVVVSELHHVSGFASEVLAVTPQPAADYVQPDDWFERPMRYSPDVAAEPPQYQYFEAGGTSALVEVDAPLTGYAAWSEAKRLEKKASWHAWCRAAGKCPYSSVYMQSRWGELKPFNCKSWSCVVCAPKLANKYAHQFGEAKPTWLATLTLLPGDPAICRMQWQHFMRCLRHGIGMKRRSSRLKVLEIVAMINAKRVHSRDNPPLPMEIAEAAVDRLGEGGYKFEYARVLERGGHGQHKLHFHLAVRGDLPPEVVLGAVAHYYKFGYVTDIQEVYDVEGAGWYLAKYLTKDGREGGFAEGFRHKVSASRKFYDQSNKFPKAPPGYWRIRGMPTNLDRDFVAQNGWFDLLKAVTPLQEKVEVIRGYVQSGPNKDLPVDFMYKHLVQAEVDAAIEGALADNEISVRLKLAARQIEREHEYDDYDVLLQTFQSNALARKERSRCYSGDGSAEVDRGLGRVPSDVPSFAGLSMAEYAKYVQALASRGQVFPFPRPGRVV